jgi:dihydrofolate reductase
MYSRVGLMHELLPDVLIDELRLWVHPAVLGTGKRLFPEGIERKNLELVDTTTFPSGVTILAYHPETD